jgi:hypothetical protein
MTSGRKGVQRRLRPLPRHLTCAPVRSSTSSCRSPVISLLRSPVWIATASRARSRRPIQVLRLGAATRAAHSSSVRNSMGWRS